LLLIAKCGCEGSHVNVAGCGWKIRVDCLDVL
jgi:hypothetical protein